MFYSTNIRLVVAVLMLYRMNFCSCRGKGAADYAFDSPSHPIPMPWVYPVKDGYVPPSKPEPFVRYQGPPIPILRGTFSPKVMEMMKENQQDLQEQKDFLMTQAIQTTPVVPPTPVTPQQVALVPPPVAVPPTTSHVIPIDSDAFQKCLKEADQIECAKRIHGKDPNATSSQIPLPTPEVPMKQSSYAAQSTLLKAAEHEPSAASSVASQGSSMQSMMEKISQAQGMGHSAPAV